MIRRLLRALAAAADRPMRPRGDLEAHIRSALEVARAETPGGLPLLDRVPGQRGRA